MKKLSVLLLICCVTLSCKTKDVSISNIDSNASRPMLRNDKYILTEIATDKIYGYIESTPINLGFSKYIKNNIASYYMDALSGPNQEVLHYKFIESCCPFITKTGGTGTGLLDKYEITWDGNNKPLYLYINKYEKGKILIPMGLSAKK